MESLKEIVEKEAKDYAEQSYMSEEDRAQAWLDFNAGWDAALAEIRKMEFQIGEYYLSNYHNGDYWLSHLGGEGMQVRKEVFEKMIADWYSANF